jgi:large subunit ribosomal protein L29e
MVKSKFHTNHNQNAKNHRNGIKRLPRNKYLSTKGVHQTLKRNTRRARKFDPNIKKEKNLSNKIAVLRTNKDKILMAIKARIEKKKLAKKPAKQEEKKAPAKKAKKN